MKIGVLGAGAIGLTLAARLATVHDVIVLTHRRATAELLERDGIAVEDGSGALRFAAVRASADADAFADRDAVIVAVKAYATGEALALLRGRLAAHALIASVQNGIGNAAAARDALPGARIVAGSTTQGAIRTAEGRVRPINRGTTTFGLDENAVPTSGDLAAAFVAAGLDAVAVAHIDAILWSKLIVNAAINPACALAGLPNGAAARDPDVVPLVRALASEAAAVARAEGFDAADPWAAVERAANATAANRNSMLADLDAGRRTEIDAISGAVVRAARAHGIAVPATDLVLHLVRARESEAANQGGMLQHPDAGPAR